MSSISLICDTQAAKNGGVAPIPTSPQAASASQNKVAPLELGDVFERETGRILRKQWLDVLELVRDGGGDGCYRLTEG